MSPRITHSKVSGKPNPTDASKVGGEDWDADHVIDGLTIGTDVQAHDTTLDALAAFDSNGILVQYGTDQFTARTLTGTANEITVANGAGASGNPTFSLPSALTFTGKTVTGGTYSGIASLSASVSNPTLVGPLSSFYAPSADSGNKAALSIQTTWDSGNGGLNGASIVANAVVETTAGAVGAPGAIIAGTLVKGDIAGLDPYGILGLINNDTAVTSGVGTALWGIVRGAKAGGVTDGLRVASEVANGQRPRFGVAVYNTETDNAFDYGVIAASANLYGVVAGNPSGTSVNDRFPTFPMAVYAKSLGTTWHDGLLLYNATAAAAGAQQMSPSIRWGGNGWKTNATAGSRFVDFRADLLPVQGTAAPSSYLRFASSVNNGAYTPNVYFTSGNGVGVGAIPSVAANNGDLTVYRGANSGAIYFGNDGTKYIYQDGTNFQFNGAGLNVGSGGTGLTSFTLGDMVYASAGTTLSKLAGNTTTTRKFLRQTGDGTNSAAPAWDTITAADVPGSALTKTDDTNITLTLGGSPTTALLNAASITVGWTGTLAPSRGGTGISSLGTGVATALGVNVGSAGAFVTFGGALGSPSSVGTLPAYTLGGTISGGGNQINNVIIGASTPLAGSFTTLSASTSITSPLHIGGSGTTGTQLTFQTTTGTGTTDGFAWVRGTAGGTLAMTLNAKGLHIGAGVNSAAVAGDITLGRSGTTGVVYFGSNGGQYVYYDGSKYNVVGGAIAIANATYLMRNTVSWTNNAAAATGTLTNAPAAGNPTKWIAIDDNGTTRYIPAW